MPIYLLQCPECQHRFTGMVFEGTRFPEVWVCPQCRSENAQMLEGYSPVTHPMESRHGGGCPCCGGGYGTAQPSSADAS